MNQDRLTRFFLETLTTAELVKMTEQKGIDIPPDLERIFIIEELLEASAGQKVESAADPDDLTEEKPEEAPEESRSKHTFEQSVDLPARYNITFIDVLVRDPLWVFVFWEVRGSDKGFYESSPDFNGYYLRLLETQGTSALRWEESFIVPVEPEDSAWYLGIPREPWEESPCRYCRVELGVRRAEEKIRLALSRPFTLPVLREDPARMERDESLSGVYANPLSSLSGLWEFPLLYHEGRPSRLKVRHRTTRGSL
jgi:hypothetical protein